jgi:hypothetical protein
MRTRFSGCSDSVVTTTACAADMRVIDSYNGDPRSARVAGVAVIVAENVGGTFAARDGAVVTSHAGADDLRVIDTRAWSPYRGAVT